MLKVMNWGCMFVKLVLEDIISELFIDVLEDLMNKELIGMVYRLIVLGLFVIMDDGICCFIYLLERKEELRLGLRVIGWVI